MLLRGNSIASQEHFVFLRLKQFGCVVTQEALTVSISGLPNQSLMNFGKLGLLLPSGKPVHPLREGERDAV